MTFDAVNKINELASGGISSQSATSADSVETPFASFLDAANKNLQEVNDLTQTADQMSVDFALGKIDNVADVMVAQEKASIALQYTVQLRSTILEAYNELMRMQV